MRSLILNSRFLILISALLIILIFYFTNNMNESTVLKINDMEISVEIADDLPEQTMGLSGRDSLCEDCGMLFVYRDPQIQRFWMKDMKFPLDFIFIKENKVVDIFEDIPVPVDSEIPRIQSREPADMVLEVNKGFVERNSIRVGDMVR